MGIVYDIMHFSTRDGPGIRTTVFLKGCPLRCQWCHNPEGQKKELELILRANLCIGCGDCAPVCEPGAITMQDALPVIDRALCNLCGACAAACNAEALAVAGREMSVDAVMAEIRKDRPFFDESGGGVTFSGGEPLSQPEFLLDLLRACKAERIHTAVNTSGCAPWKTIAAVAPLADLILYDVKVADSDLHKKYTGVTNRLILENLARLSAQGKRIVVRVPVIPGYNDSPEAVKAVGQVVAGLPALEKVELLPYHQAGVEKYRRLNRPYALTDVRPPSSEQMLAAAQILLEYFEPVVIGG